MKIRTILSAIFISLSFALFAQENVDAQVQKMTDLVGLNKDQQAKYKTYLVNKDKEKKELMAKYKDDTGSDAKKKAQADFKAKYDAQLKTILTPDQLKKLTEKK